MPNRGTQWSIIELYAATPSKYASISTLISWRQLHSRSIVAMPRISSNMAISTGINWSIIHRLKWLDINDEMYSYMKPAHHRPPALPEIWGSGRAQASGIFNLGVKWPTCAPDNRHAHFESPLCMVMGQMPRLIWIISWSGRGMIEADTSKS